MDQQNNNDLHKKLHRTFDENCKHVIGFGESTHCLSATCNLENTQL